MRAIGPNAFFVYGTLMRGGANVQVWPASPTRVSRASITASLYDLGAYPGMVAGNDKVLGECWWFADRDIATVVAAIDALEDHRGRADDEYSRERVRCQLVNGFSQQAWVYRYLGSVEGGRLIAADGSGRVRWREPADRSSLAARASRLGLGPA